MNYLYLVLFLFSINAFASNKDLLPRQTRSASSCNYHGTPRIVHLDFDDSCIKSLCVAEIECDTNQAPDTGPIIREIACPAKDGVCPDLKECAKDPSVTFNEPRSNSDYYSSPNKNRSISK